MEVIHYLLGKKNRKGSHIMRPLHFAKICITNLKIHKIKLVIQMKISWLKLKEDNNSFKIFKNIGFDVYDVEDGEDTDKKIKELVNKDYKTIVISNELAGFSEDIIKKYNKSQNVNIIIASNNKQNNDI